MRNHVVVPLSVMSNWEKQIEDHVQPGALTSCVYYGKTRDMSPAELKRYDVVITTYQTLASDYMLKGKGGSNKQPERKLRSSGLYSLQWRRVILDEGHTVRNPASKGAAAVIALMARSRCKAMQAGNRTAEESSEMRKDGQERSSWTMIVASGRCSQPGRKEAPVRVCGRTSIRAIP